VLLVDVPLNAPRRAPLIPSPEKMDILTFEDIAEFLVIEK
jgi:hypothetical protein